MISRFQVQLPNPTCNSGGRWRPPTGSKLTAPVTTIGGKVGQFWRIPGAQPGKPHTIQKESWIRRYQGDISKHVQGNALDGLCDVFVFNRQSIEQQHMMKLPTKTVIKQVVMNKCLSCSKFAFFPRFFWGKVNQHDWKKTKNDSWQHSSAWIQTVEPVWSRNWRKRLDQLGFKHPSPELVGLVLTPELDELCAPVAHQFQNGLDGNIPVEFTGGNLNIMPWSYQQGKIWPVSLYMTSYMAQRLRLGFLEWTTEKIMVKTQRQKSPDVGYTVILT